MPSSIPHGRPAAARIQAIRIRRDLTPESAQWLFDNVYTPFFGPLIRFETPRTLRLKIRELEQILLTTQRPSVAFQVVARNILLYERVAEILEKLPR